MPVPTFEMHHLPSALKIRNLAMMDARAGNLLGEEQSGHIREVGYELYQDMLEEAIARLARLFA